MTEHRRRQGNPLRLVAPALLLAAGLAPTAARAGAPVNAPARAFVPYSEDPINYLSDDVDDPVARLQARVDRGEAKLTYEPEHGYLKSVLKRLDIPVSSQTLVFSKTSLQYRKISPATPRALYFNDNVYVGWVKGGDLLEVSSFDANQGAIFYVIEQKPVEQPALLRATIDCTQCHVARETRGIPGVLLKSVFPNPTGSPAARTPTFLTGHESPLKDRFGGWYVSGTHGKQTHMGNAVVKDRDHPDRLDRDAGANLLDVSDRFQASAYLTGHSDIVAQLVLAHQTQMHNLITLVNYKTRMTLYADAQRAGGGVKTVSTGAGAKAPASEASRKLYEEPAEELLRYLLFANEAPLDGPVVGTSGFTEEFAALGPRDPKGRSLREFDLNRRLFRYPCSYLIDSEAFDAIPEPAKGYVYRRLLEVLTGRDRSPAFAKLSDDDRQAVLEILVATKRGLPDDWKRAPQLTARRAPGEDTGDAPAPKD